MPEVPSLPESPADDLLRLDRQVCFPLYAASRLVTRRYQPLLEPFGITYPQYIVLMILCWFGIRQQVAVSDRQFLRSMIPHHAGAILMCKQNRLNDPDLQQLCRGIVTSQQSEIDLMKAKLEQRPSD